MTSPENQPWATSLPEEAAAAYDADGPVTRPLPPPDEGSPDVRGGHGVSPENTTEAEGWV